MPCKLRRCLVGGVCLVVLVLAGAACSRAAPPPDTQPATAIDTPVPTALPATFTAAPPPTPTLTPVPLAALVNGAPITLAAYEQEVARCQAGLAGAGYDAAECPAVVLQSLIEQAVMEQAAAGDGLAVSGADVDAALAQIQQELGGPDALAAWQQANLYTPADFRAALAGDLLRARLAEQVTAGLPTAVEQVYARAILVTAEDTAQAVLAELQAGADFATVALNYSRDLTSRAAGGDLGWFPRGVLTVPEVEDAAFALQPGEISGIVRSSLGFHIVQTIERDPARPLSPASAQTLRAAAFTAWLDDLVARAAVEQFVSH